MADDPLQKKYLELYLIDQQVQQLQQQLVLMENQTLEITKLLESLDDLEKSKENSSLLAPIAPGVFIQAAVKDNKNLIVNAGASVFITKTIQESRELFSKQLKEIQDAMQQIEPMFSELQRRAHQLQHEIRKLKPKEEQED